MGGEVHKHRGRIFFAVCSALLDYSSHHQCLCRAVVASAVYVRYHSRTCSAMAACIVRQRGAWACQQWSPMHILRSSPTVTKRTKSETETSA